MNGPEIATNTGTRTERPPHASHVMPPIPYLNVERVRQLLEQGHPQEAERSLRAVLATMPFNSATASLYYYLLRTHTCRQLQQWEEASQFWNQQVVADEAIMYSVRAILLLSQHANANVDIFHHVPVGSHFRKKPCKFFSI